MARRGLQYLLKRIKQIAVLSIGTAVFLGLSIVSLTQAGPGEGGDGGGKITASPASIMQILMMPDGSPIDRCLIPTMPLEEEKCRSFHNIDEDVLQNLFQSYKNCLDDSYYLNFSNQPAIKLSRPLIIYGRTEKPLIIKGLKLSPAAGFPMGSPAITVYGKAVSLDDVRLNGFDNGILFASEDNSRHKLTGGNINGAKDSGLAIEACHNPPAISGTSISGYEERVSVIE